MADRELEALKAEIEFYKDMASKVFTADLLAIAGTVTTLKTSGLNFWSSIGIIASYGLSLVFGMLVFAYKSKINQLRGK